MLGLLTYSAHPNLTDDDHLLVRALLAKGIHYQIVDWNRGLPGREITHLLIRSPWDYYLKPHKFLKYLEDCEAAGIQVINNSGIVRWNHAKQYLNELKSKGLDIVDSVFVSPGTPIAELQAQLNQKKWSEVVIKPTISGSSYLTFRTNTNSPEFQPQTEKVLAHGDLMAQPFLPSIRDSGEISLIYFFDKKPVYSHSVHKKPKSGDFRVQNDFGGASVFIEPGENLKKLSEKIMAALPKGWLYVRIDLVDCDKTPLISEIELIEPSLYFLQYPPAADTLAEIISANKLF